MKGRPRHPSPLILARGAVQVERTLGTLCLGRDLFIFAVNGTTHGPKPSTYRCVRVH